jgi:hypothetical protein
MVYNTQNYWVSGLLPSSGILENRKPSNSVCWQVNASVDHIRVILKALAN